MKKRERKKEENYFKKGVKGLKNASFWAINSKKNFPYIRYKNTMARKIENHRRQYFRFTAMEMESVNEKLDTDQVPTLNNSNIGTMQVP